MSSGSDFRPSGFGVYTAKAFNRLQHLAISGVNRWRGFRLRGERYSYCVGDYNSAWHNERTVEVSIGLHYLDRYRGRQVLEVGNVLGHYTPVTHDIVDKYEHAPSVLNVDVLDFKPEGAYDLIVSLSTLEHVGWDEDVADWPKPIRAVEHLVSLLKPSGTLLATLPLGYNPHVDRALREDAFGFDEVTYLKRISRDNRWREIGKADVGVVRYGRPFPAANVVAVATATGR